MTKDLIAKLMKTRTKQLNLVPNYDEDPRVKVIIVRDCNLDYTKPRQLR
jgi:hypothetical protein